MHEAPERRIPVVVLTGFLGAGKTTLLNSVLGRPGMSATAVLINEFGEVGLDHLLVEKIDETLVVLDAGCICCSIQGDLVRVLKSLFKRAMKREIPRFERVVIETTGLADPAPVIHTLMSEPFIAARFRCDGVVTAIAAPHGAHQLDTQREAVRQVAMADRLLVTQCDLAPDAALAALELQLAVLNPGAAREHVRHGVASETALAGCGLYDPAGKIPDVAQWLGEAAPPPVPAYTRTPRPASHTRHAPDVDSFTLIFDSPLDWLAFSDALGLVLQMHGERILRVKGLLDVAGDPLPRVVQCVQHAAYPPSSLAAWPDNGPCADRRSRLVFIVRGLARDKVVRVLSGLLQTTPRVV